MPYRGRACLSAMATSHIWTVLAILILLTNGLYGQQDFRGSIQGYVKDPSGAIIPGVTVTLTLASQNRTRSVVTDDNGFYAFTHLDPGSYQLKAVMPGFKTYERTDTVVQVSDKLTIDITLSVGDVSQEIVVRGDAVPIIQEISNFDQVVDEKQISDLPVNARNSYLLFGLAAGVLPEGDPTRIRPFDNDDTSNLTVGGTGSRGTEFALDGGTNTTAGGRVVFIPSTEAVKEFKVTTSSFDASVGNTTGAIISTSIKSGGKDFHGSLYEHFRSNVLNANFWNTKRVGVPLSPSKWHQFGGSLGGPLRLPFGPRGGKDRTFFFINYEGMRQDRPYFPYTRTVPTERERAGDFSETYYVTGSGQIRPITIYDPRTTRCVNNCDRPQNPTNPAQRLGPTFRRDPFPGNIIPPERMDPVALRLLRFIPLPNRPGDPRTGRDNFLKNGSEFNDYAQLIARIDRQLSERQNLFFSLGVSDLDNLLPNWLGSIASPNLGIVKRQTRRIAIDDTYMFSGGMVMNVQYALSRYLNYVRQASIGVDLAEAGFAPEHIAKIQEVFKEKEGKTAFPDIDIPNYIRLGTSGDHVKSRIANDTHLLAATFTKIKGKHGLRWGISGQNLRSNEYSAGLPSSRLSFGKAFTHGPNPSAGETAAAGNEFANFLLGYPTDGYIEQRTDFAVQDLYLGAYFQDDFKIGKRLTINAGLRWEYWFPRTERYNRMTRGFAHDKENPLAPTVRQQAQRILNDGGYAQALMNLGLLSNRAYELSQEVRDILSRLELQGGLQYAARDGAPRGMLQSRWNLFAPRFGFAYKLSNKMVLRGGFGRYFEPLSRIGAPPQTGFHPRTPYEATVTDDEYGPRPANTLSNPFPGELIQAYGSSLGMLTNIGQGISFLNPERTAPSTLRAEFGLQRELPWRIGVQANYMTTRWHGRPVGVELNDLPDSFLARGADYFNQTVPNPFFGVIPCIRNPNPVTMCNNELARPRIALHRLLRPYPLFTSVSTSFNYGYGWYHGFNINVSRRFSRGMFFQATYTLSKGMTATTYANTDDRRINRLDRRLLDDDRPQRLVFNGIYELPFGRSKRFFRNGWGSKLLGGWQMSGIATFMSGYPIRVHDNRQYAVTTGLPYQLPKGPYFDPSIQRWVWFNRAAFRPRCRTVGQSPATGLPSCTVVELMDVPRNLPNVRVHGVNNIDMRLTRTLPINERVRLQFIGEVFNMMNRVQFAPPNTDIRNRNFGTTASQANWPRSYQFALRLQF